MQHIARSEPQELITSLYQPVLPAVVSGEARAMSCAVVLDREPGARIKEVRPCDKDPIAIKQRELRHRLGKAMDNNKYAEATLHRALRRGVRHVEGLEQPRNPP